MVTKNFRNLKEKGEDGPNGNTTEGYCKHPVGNYIFKVNNRNTTTICEICLKLTIKTPE